MQNQEIEGQGPRGAARSKSWLTLLGGSAGAVSHVDESKTGAQLGLHYIQLRLTAAEGKAPLDGELGWISLVATPTLCDKNLLLNR